MGNHFKIFLTRYYLFTFILMGLSFIAMALLSFNLIYLFRANLNLFLEHGQQVLYDGALRQLIELIITGYLGMGFYLIFKVCEKILVDRVTGIKRENND